MNGDRRRFLRAGLAAGTLAFAGCAASPPTSDGDGATNGGTTAPDDAGGDGTHEVETIVDDLDQPWGLAVAPDGATLVTERPGGFVRAAPDGTTTRIDGTPEVFAGGQGGLLDVALHPDYPDSPWVYLTYSVANGAGETTTRLGRGLLAPDGARLDDFEVLHTAEPFVESNGHFGSRVVFGPDDRAYVTVGDRQFKDFGPEHTAQDLTTDHGAVLRFEPDGSIPSGNPFVDDPDARDPIFSYGHRNPQGLAVHPGTGDLWEHEHGEQDGDEINILQQGGNFGWPVATEACTYGGGEPIGVSHDDRADVVAPVHYWPCGSGGFPPSGLAIYDGSASAWSGDLFAGNLAGQYLGRFAVDGREVTEVGQLLADREWRIRAVTVGPDDGLLVAVDADPGPLVRLTPA
ncbi:PQQ-dependent sugar dehydrogenase [Halobellus ruber]|uniref:PQQ-dependent sugar dehydrogenase n=1 Tax=Halobellus ruber TaxID=2761102 RepID=A0A7J9SJ45_9EURY|nr:PQQ-dependent sugar dehydrogenase [Halobellus ruber]MBB6646974.1 PQQ-dependent sugar dehydrogenase [Halobellus ruber]